MPDWKRAHSQIRTFAVCGGLVRHSGNIPVSVSISDAPENPTQQSSVFLTGVLVDRPC
jgi:hypothetical protein